MRVNFYATLRAIVGEKTVEVDLAPGASVLDLAAAIGARWPEIGARMLEADGALSRRVHVLLDGRNVRWLPDGAATRIGAEQTVDVFPPTAGG